MVTLTSRVPFQGPYKLNAKNAGTLRAHAPGVAVFERQRYGVTVSAVTYSTTNLRGLVKRNLKKRKFDLFRFFYAHSSDNAFWQACDMFHDMLKNGEQIDCQRHPRPVSACHLCAFQFDMRKLLSGLGA